MFTSPVDVANRALQHIGEKRVAAFGDSRRGAVEAGFCIDKLRRAELRRAVWTFSTRRMVVRALTSTSVRLVFPTWSSTTAYTAGDIVQDSTGFRWIATASSTGVDPTGSSNYGVNPPWVAYFGQLYADTYGGSVAYYPGDMVVNSSVVYLCIAPTTGNAPPNTTYFHAPQSVTTSALVAFSPDGYPGPVIGTRRNRLPLPNNFMRLAAQDAKQPGTATLSVTAGLNWNDWEIENGFIYSAATAGPIILRFVADTADVTAMEDLFCEAWAARMAIELAPIITQNPDKSKEVEPLYDTAINGARLIAAIELGSTEEELLAAGAAPLAGSPQAQQQR